MAVLFASGEDTGFVTGAPGGGVANVSAGTNRSTYSRTSIMPSNIEFIANDPPTYRFRSQPFTASTLIWIHAQIYSTANGPITNQQMLRALSPDGVARVLFRNTATMGQIKLSTRNAAGTITDVTGGTFSSALLSNTMTALDIRLDFSTSGGAQVWLNGVQVLNYSGNLRTDAATQLNQLEFANIGNAQLNWSEIIVADEDTRGWALWTLTPGAAGNTQGWTPNTVGNINEITINDGTYVSTATNNTLSQWALTSPTAPTGNWQVKGLVQEARVLVGSGPQHFDWSVRTASTDYLAGASVAPTTSFANYGGQIWTTNPNTGAVWTTANFTVAGFNYGLKSLA